MSRSLNPQNHSSKIPPEQLGWAQSIHKVLNGGVDMGTPTGQDTTTGAGINAGVYTQFDRGNSSGTLIRIAANGSSNTGASYTWGAVNVGIPVKHGLDRQPIGFFVADADKDVRVYRTAAPDATQITLAPTDNTASVTVYVF